MTPAFADLENPSVVHVAVEGGRRRGEWTLTFKRGPVVLAVEAHRARSQVAAYAHARERLKAHAAPFAI